ncbi:hypothetical protein COLO4_25357 [Corchorus olitorius]|uniref:Uncharacterized protein n=1 Tax=Corchorus olitorius TaxID=93759 RepID=A0A1R3I3C1_9ROSI|nr:hypothetical protein COLO4_25357 [Corchorus olitorius]
MAKCLFTRFVMLRMKESGILRARVNYVEDKRWINIFAGKSTMYWKKAPVVENIRSFS